MRVFRFVALRDTLNHLMETDEELSGAWRYVTMQYADAINSGIPLMNTSPSPGDQLRDFVTSEGVDSLSQYIRDDASVIADAMHTWATSPSS
jgi:hypothetical protein